MAGNFRALAGTAAGTCFLLLLCERLFFFVPMFAPLGAFFSFLLAVGIVVVL